MDASQPDDRRNCPGYRERAFPDPVGFRRHVGDDVGRRANRVDAADRLADQYGGGLEILCGDSGFEGA